jgi:triosephosphate isomerase
MRTPILAANWKMHYTHTEAKAVAADIAQRVAGLGGVEVAIAAPATSLQSVAEALAGSRVGLAAQNMHAEDKGAYTGEVSAPMLVALGCKYVILGHSERRQLFGETDEGVHRKLKVALEHGLTPIVCIGESLQEREAGQTEAKVAFQVRAALSGLSAADVPRVVLAYEPIWAIGTGKTATPEQAQEVHAAIRALVAAQFGQATADALRIQYGGSVKPDNAASLMACADIDGALVGGASLKADSFAAICAAAAT